MDSTTISSLKMRKDLPAVVADNAPLQHETLKAPAEDTTPFPAHFVEPGAAPERLAAAQHYAAPSGEPGRGHVALVTARERRCCHPDGADGV